VIARSADGLGVDHFIAYRVSLLVAWVATGLCLLPWTRNSAIIFAVLLALLPSALGRRGHAALRHRRHYATTSRDA
jgi:hypothetical protein